MVGTSGNTIPELMVSARAKQGPTAGWESLRPLMGPHWQQLRLGGTSGSPQMEARLGQKIPALGAPIGGQEESLHPLMGPNWERSCMVRKSGCPQMQAALGQNRWSWTVGAQP